MISLNRLQLIGHIAEDSKFRDLQNGTSVADVNLLVKTVIRNSGGEEKEVFSYHSVTFWRGLADVIKNYTKKGSQIYVSGRLETDTWEDPEGNKRYKTKVVAEDLVLLSRKQESKAPDGFLKITSGLNKAEILGNITGNLELRTTPGGVSVTSFGVATNRQWKTTSGETQEKAEFHNIVVWEKLAEDLCNIATKGSKLYICGRIQNRSWETPDGQKKYTTEIIAESIRVLGFINDTLGPANVGDKSGDDFEDFDSSASKSSSKPSIPDVDYSTEIKPEDLPF